MALNKEFYRSVCAGYVSGFDAAHHKRPDHEAIGPFAKTGFRDYETMTTGFDGHLTPSIDKAPDLTEEDRQEARALVSHLREVLTDLQKERFEPDQAGRIRLLFNRCQLVLDTGAARGWENCPAIAAYLGEIGKAPAKPKQTETARTEEKIRADVEQFGSRFGSPAKKK